MSTMNTVSTRSIPMVPSQMATPPPTRHVLSDAGTRVGWIEGRALGFHGFADEMEAMHAAWVGYRTMSRRFARALGRRPIPIDSEHMSLERSGDAELILAAGRPVATLLRPGSASPGGPGSFGFELQIPLPTDEATMRKTADLVYRAMRRSGIRWQLWTPVPPAPPAPPEPVTTLARDDEKPAAASASSARRSLRAHAARWWARATSASTLATAFVILALLALIGLPAITATSLTVLLGGAAAAVALLALASLVVLIVKDTGEMLFGLARRPGVPRPSHRFVPAADGTAAAAPRWGTRGNPPRIAARQAGASGRAS